MVEKPRGERCSKEEQLNAFKEPEVGVENEPLYLGIKRLFKNLKE